LPLLGDFEKIYQPGSRYPLYWFGAQRPAFPSITLKSMATKVSESTAKKKIQSLELKKYNTMT